MAKEKFIVAAELLDVRQKQSLLDSLAYTFAGDKIAGLAGAYVGANLAPVKTTYFWRVRYDDGSYQNLQLGGNDPRNNIFMNLPYLPEYEEFINGVPLIDEGGEAVAQSENMDGQIGDVFQADVSTGDNREKHDVAMDFTTNMAKGMLEVGAGDYIFGENFPEGFYDLKVISGSGILTLKEKDGGHNFVWIGDQRNGDGVYSWNGIRSTQYEGFTINGNARVQFTPMKILGQ